MFFIICNSVITEEQEEAIQGKQLLLNSFQEIIFGVDEDKAYRDVFVNTARSALDRLDNISDLVTLNEILRLFIQTTLILITNKRPDLITTDFTGLF